MGVDAKLFILTEGSTAGRDYVEHVLTFERDVDLWRPLDEAVKSARIRRIEELHLPAAEHATYRDGEVPEGWDNREQGFLSRNPYGGELWAVKGRELKDVRRLEQYFPGWESPWNDAVLALAAEYFPDRDVVVWWC